jgi:hypothetical protein
VNAHLKVPCLVAGMAAGADSVDAMDLLRHGAMSTLFGGIRAPSTRGSRLRSYARGNVAQLEKAGREFLIALTGRRRCCPAETCWRSPASTRCRSASTGTRKQGARFGDMKIQGKTVLVPGLNALAAVISTPLSAPVIATAWACGCTGTIMVRMDSAFYGARTIAAISRPAPGSRSPSR